jgi:hypothetical protein
MTRPLAALVAAGRRPRRGCSVTSRHRQRDQAVLRARGRLTASLNAWYANAGQIAAFLSEANPRNWPLAMMRSMMKQHLDLHHQGGGGAA